MIVCAVVPTARIASALKKYTSVAAMNAAMNTLTLARLTELSSSTPGTPLAIWRPLMTLILSM